MPYRMNNGRCGDCKYHRHDRTSGDWVCINPESDRYGDWTEYNDKCDDYEEKD